MDVGMWLEPVRLRLIFHCASIRLLICARINVWKAGCGVFKPVSTSTHLKINAQAVCQVQRCKLYRLACKLSDYMVISLTFYKAVWSYMSQLSAFGNLAG